MSGRGGRDRRWLLALFSVVVAPCILGVGVAVAATADEGPQDEPAVPGSATPAEPVRELPAKRTATSDTYRLSDGILGTKIYGSPINYQDPEGDWKPIEEGLTEAANGTIVNGDNSFDVTLPSRLQAAPLRLSVDGHWVSSQLVGGEETRAAEMSDGSAVYESTISGTAVEYATVGGGLEERIEVPGPSAPSTFHFKLDASDGLTPSLSARTAQSASATPRARRSRSWPRR